MRVAAWQYPIELHASFDAWRAKIDRAASDAKAAGAELLVMPEYSSMELTAILPRDEQVDLQTQLSGMQRLVGDYLTALSDTAKQHSLAIVGGSFPERVVDLVHNRLRVFGPRGDSVLVEKLQMTRFERELWGIVGGSAQPVIELGPIRLGVAICYDAEFPLIVRRLVDAGANVIAVPSCTDGLAGYHRVRVACAARALENQCYVVQAPTVGIAPWSIALDENVGAAGVFAPPDKGFPSDGIVAMGPLDQGHLVIADLDLAKLDAVRRDGQVLVHRDWSAPSHLVGETTLVRLASADRS